jgi:tetratricopeptide (TPR) repeat protein
VQIFAEIDNDVDGLAARITRLEALAGNEMQRCELRIQQATAEMLRGDGTRAVSLAQQALELALPAGDASLIARSRRVLGSALSIVDRLDDAARQLEAALAWLHEHADEARRGEAHGELALVYDNLGRLDEALPHHRLSYELCSRAGRLTDAAAASGNLACNRIDAGDLDAADAALVQSEQWVAANDGLSSTRGMQHILRALTLAHLGRYRDALIQAELAWEATRRSQGGYQDRARLRVAQVWWHLGQWTRVRQHLEALDAGADAVLPLRVHHALLQWHCAVQGLGARDALVRARSVLDALADELADGHRPDQALLLRIERAAMLEPGAALDELQSARDLAQRIGHGGAVFAAQVRSAAAAVGTDPARARAIALDALARHERGLRSTILLPAEPWLHIGRALHEAGEAAAVDVLRGGVEWLRRTADTHVPEAFRDSFLRRNPVNRELLALAARLGVR